MSRSLRGRERSCDLLTELKMIDVNIKSVHILTRMFLKDMVKKNKGYILKSFGSGIYVSVGEKISVLALLFIKKAKPSIEPAT